jgi:hypothetical protein
MIRFRWLLVFSTSIGLVAGQVSCDIAQTMAQNNFDELTGKCVNRAQLDCSPDFCHDCINTEVQGNVLCVDGCTYCQGDLCVTRTMGGGNIMFGQDTGMTGYANLITTFYTFASGAQGSARFQGPPIQFFFNDVECSVQPIPDCTNEVQTANGVNILVDCTNVQGGGILDYCQSDLGVVIEPNQPLSMDSVLEQLILVPLVACGEVSLGDDDGSINGDGGGGMGGGSGSVTDLTDGTSSSSSQNVPSASATGKTSLSLLAIGLMGWMVVIPISL